MFPLPQAPSSGNYPATTSAPRADAPAPHDDKLEDLLGTLMAPQHKTAAPTAPAPRAPPLPLLRRGWVLAG
jgi:hypothetical protein